MKKIFIGFILICLSITVFSQSNINDIMDSKYAEFLTRYLNGNMNLAKQSLIDLAVYNFNVNKILFSDAIQDTDGKNAAINSLEAWSLTTLTTPTLIYDATFDNTFITASIDYLTIDDSLMFGTFYVKGISNDTTLSDNDSLMLVTEYAAKNYIDNKKTVIDASISDGITSDYVSIDSLYLAYWIDGISNDTTLTDEDSTDLITEYGVKNYVDNKKTIIDASIALKEDSSGVVSVVQNTTFSGIDIDDAHIDSADVNELTVDTVSIATVLNIKGADILAATAGDTALMFEEARTSFEPITANITNYSTDSMRLSSKIRIVDSLFFSTSTYTINDTTTVYFLPDGKLRFADSIRSAAAGWEYELEPFDDYYNKCKEMKALELPYPDGTKRRQINAIWRDYQIEYELERLTRYLYVLSRENNRLMKELNKKRWLKK